MLITASDWMKWHCTDLCNCDLSILFCSIDLGVDQMIGRQMTCTLDVWYVVFGCCLVPLRRPPSWVLFWCVCVCVCVFVCLLAILQENWWQLFHETFVIDQWFCSRAIEFCVHWLCATFEAQTEASSLSVSVCALQSDAVSVCWSRDWLRWKRRKLTMCCLLVFSV